MDEKKYDNTQTMFVKTGRTGELYGNCEWTDGVQLYANNFHDEGGFLVADVRMPTDETYINKAGKECKVYKTVGILKCNAEKAVMVVDLNEKKEILMCKPREVTTKAGETMTIMNFRGDDTPRAANPYAADLEAISDLPF